METIDYKFMILAILTMYKENGRVFKLTADHIRSFSYKYNAPFYEVLNAAEEAAYIFRGEAPKVV